MPINLFSCERAPMRKSAIGSIDKRLRITAKKTEEKKRQRKREKRENEEGYTIALFLPFYRKKNQFSFLNVLLLARVTVILFFCLNLIEETW